MGPTRSNCLTCRKDQSKPIVVNAAKVVNFTIPAGDDKGGGYKCSLSTFPYIDGTTVLSLTGDDESTAVVMPFPSLSPVRPSAPST